MAKAAPVVEPCSTPPYSGNPLPGSQSHLETAIATAIALGHHFSASSNHRTGSLFSQCRGCGAVITVSPSLHHAGADEYEVAGRALVETCAEVRAFAAAEEYARAQPHGEVGTTYTQWTIVRFRDVPSAAREGDTRALKANLKRAETLRRSLIAQYALAVGASIPTVEYIPADAVSRTGTLWRRG